MSFITRTLVDLGIVRLTALSDVMTDSFSVIREADVTQLGTQRLRFAVESHLEIPTAFYVVVDLAALPGPFPRTVDAITHAIIAVAPVYVRGPSGENIEALQAALKPGLAATDASIRNHAALRETVENLDTTDGIVRAKILTLINQQAITNSGLRSVISNLPGVDVDARTVMGAGAAAAAGPIIQLGVNHIRDLEMDDVYSITTNLVAATSREQRIIDNYILLRTHEEDHSEPDQPVGESVLVVIRELPSYTGLLQSVMSDLQARSFTCPEALAAYYQLPSPFSRAEVVVIGCCLPTTPALAYDEARAAYVTSSIAQRKTSLLYGDAPPFQDAVADSGYQPVWFVVIPPANADFYGSIAYAGWQSLKATNPGTTIEQKALFAMSRTWIVRENLYNDSDEVINLPGLQGIVPGLLASTYVEQGVFTAIITHTNNPERSRVYAMASVISFMKSGHHGTASGLVNTVTKLLGALQVVGGTEEAIVAAIIPYATYAGTHAASTRLAYGKLLYKAATTDMSYAITRRLVPTPPGTVGFVTAMIFLKALNRAMFFHFLGKQAAFDELVVSYNDWLPRAKLAAPYARYMYNDSLSESVVFRDLISGWLPYCAAMPAVMPTSSLKLSVALSRESANAASNDIVGPLVANAYGTGIAISVTRAVRQAIESGSINLIGM